MSLGNFPNYNLGNFQSYALMGDFLFEHNWAAEKGGGLLMKCDIMRIDNQKPNRIDFRNLTFKQNAAGYKGGGMAVENDNCQFDTTIYIFGSTFEENEARLEGEQLERNPGGGGLSLDSPLRNLVLNLVDAKFTRNRAVGGQESKGGAVYLEDAAYFTM